MANYVILVDENDNDIGVEEKIIAHKKKNASQSIFNFSF